ncbi:hypothetical protein LARV_03695, partial [Longilinea arvoryzae]
VLHFTETILHYCGDGYGYAGECITILTFY